MEVLSRELEEFLNALVTFAGDPKILQEAIAAVNQTSHAPSLEELVREIVRLKALAEREADSAVAQ